MLGSLVVDGNRMSIIIFFIIFIYGYCSRDFDGYFFIVGIEE